MRLSGMLSVALTLAVIGCGSNPAPLKELQRTHAGMFDVVLLSEGDVIKQGKGSFVLEFRNAQGALVDVGAVMLNASMPMPGMAPMFGTMTVLPDAMKGRYHVSSDLGMAGTWRMMISWSGPAGQGSASMPATAL